MDLFPHNPHFELVIVFERVSRDQLRDLETMTVVEAAETGPQEPAIKTEAATAAP